MPVLSTIEAKCKDCYKCLRACPVKAIRFRAGDGTSDGSPLAGRALHAEVVEERCILDGACLRVCPQGAKRVRPDVGRVKGWLESGEKVVASVAPSFAAAFPEEPLKVVGAVRSLGFAAVEQTAVGAELVAEAVREECRAVSSGSCRRPVLPVITTACPVVVNLMEMVYPDTLRHASAVVSPMVAHGRALKRAHPGARVVFIGPCVAKKHEAEREEVTGAVDAVLTFVELWDWLADEGVSLAEAEPSDFDGYRPETAPLFPVEGGMLRTASLPSDLVSGEWLALSGMDDCREFLAALSGGGGLPEELRGVRLVEMLACRGGCVAGPVMPDDGSTPAVRRQRLLRFVETRRRGTGGGAGGGRALPDPAGEKARGRPRLEPADLTRTYRDRRPELKTPSEKEVREILARVGKTRPEDELDCG
ncbi:MAG TPA: histidine kinase, partial [Clostridiales bacterium]|nr:histidine kinase [Clostridiales bacterium]